MYTIGQPDPSRLTTVQLESEIALASAAIQAFVATAQYQMTMPLPLHEFPSAPSDAEIRAVTHQAVNPESERIAGELGSKILDVEGSLNDARRIKQQVRTGHAWAAHSRPWPRVPDSVWRARPWRALRLRGLLR